MSVLIYFTGKDIPEYKTTMYHIFIEIYFCDKYYAQEEIFHICGEEVNLYLAGVNRFKEIQNIKYKERNI